MNETQVIDLALRELALKCLPQYEADEGALTANQLDQAKQSAPTAKGGSLRSKLFDVEAPVLGLLGKVSGGR